MCIRCINQGLIRKIELGCPVYDAPACEFAPLLTYIALLRNALAANKRPAWKFLKVLYVVGETQAAGQLHIRRNLIIELAEHSPLFELIGIVAQKIIVPLSVHLVDRIGIYISAANSTGERILDVRWIRWLWPTRIGNRRVEWDVRRIDSLRTATGAGISHFLRDQRHQIREDVVIFASGVVEVISTDDEIPEPLVIRT